MQTYSTAVIFCVIWDLRRLVIISVLTWGGHFGEEVTVNAVMFSVVLHRPECPWMCVCLWDHALGCCRNSSDTVTEGQRNMATAARKSQQGNVTRFLPDFNTHEHTNTYTAEAEEWNSPVAVLWTAGCAHISKWITLSDIQHYSTSLLILHKKVLKNWCNLLFLWFFFKQATYLNFELHIVFCVFWLN